MSVDKYASATHFEHGNSPQLHSRSPLSGMSCACRSREIVRHWIGVRKYASLSPLQREGHELDNYEFDSIFREHTIEGMCMILIFCCSYRCHTTPHMWYVQSFLEHCTSAMSRGMILSLASWRNIKGAEGRKRGHSRQRYWFAVEKTNIRWQMKFVTCLKG